MISMYADAANFGIQAEFVRNNSEVEVTEVASNVLRIRNYTGRKSRFTLAWSIPAGWSMMGSRDKMIELEANDSLFIPIRIIPEKIAKGGTSYITTVMLVSEQGMQFAAQNWYIRIREHINWKGQLPVKQVFFINGNDSANFFVNLRNDGNTDESIRLELSPDRRLTLYRKGEDKASSNIYELELPVGTDTTLSFTVVRRPVITRRQKDADLRKQIMKESYSVLVKAKGQHRTSWSSSVQFFKAGDHAQRNAFSHTSLPLTLEANVFDMLTQGTTMAVDAFGNAQIGDNRFLNYRFQSVFVTNYLNQNTFLGLNHYIGYFDTKNSIEVGEINGWGRSLLTGRGIKASHTFGKNTFGAMLTGTPGILDRSRTQGIGFYHNLRTNNLIWNNYYSRHSNFIVRLNSDIYNSSLSYKINRFHQIVIGGGISNDIATGLNSRVAAYGYDVNYSGSYKRLSFGAGTNTGSKYYALARGVTMYNGRLTYHTGGKYNFTLFGQRFDQLPGYYANDSLTDGNSIRSTRVELRWGINTAVAGAAIRPTFIQEENAFLKVVNRGIGFEYNPRNIPTARFSMNAYAGYIRIPGTNIPDFFISRLSISSRWNQTFISIRYQYGANTLIEQSRFIDDKVNPQLLNIMASEDYWFGNGKFLLTTTGNFNYQSYWQRYSLRVRPELFYYAKSGIRFSCYASFLTASQQANPQALDIPNRIQFEDISNTDLNFGFGVRKTLGVPVPGKKYGTARIVVFKDANGNGKQDKDEDGIPNVLIHVKALRLFGRTEDSTQVLFGEDLVTNEKGEVYYENIPAGVYSIRPTSLTGQSEWMDGAAQELTIDSKQTVLIPLNRGVKLTGVLYVAREKYSDETPIDVGRIRVTAVDSSGKAYSVLTDRKGEFAMYLPTGVFMVTINESALGEKFILQQNRIVLDLTKVTGTYKISFNAVEKRRKMDIKKFNNSKEEGKN